MRGVLGVVVLAMWAVGCGAVAPEDEAAALATEQQAVVDPPGHFYRCETDAAGVQTGRCVLWFALGCGVASTRHCTVGVVADPPHASCGRQVNNTVCD